MSSKRAKCKECLLTLPASSFSKTQFKLKHKRAIACLQCAAGAAAAAPTASRHSHAQAKALPMHTKHAPLSSAWNSNSNNNNNINTNTTSTAIMRLNGNFENLNLNVQNDATALKPILNEAQFSLAQKLAYEKLVQALPWLCNAADDNTFLRSAFANNNYSFDGAYRFLIALFPEPAWHTQERVKSEARTVRFNRLKSYFYYFSFLYR